MLQAPHQLGIKGAAATQHQAAAACAEANEGIAAALGGQRGQRGLHIGGRCAGKTLQVLLQPRGVEQVAPGAFGWHSGQEGLLQQALQQGGDDLARRCPGPIAVEGLAGVLLAPGIHQRIARAAVEAGDRAGMGGGQDAEIGDATDVQCRHRLVGAAKHGLVESGYQRRTLAAGCHIAAAEVADDGDICQFGEKGRVADLNGKASGGFMANRLAMAANRPNVLRPEVLLIQQGVDALSGKRYPLLLSNC